jgi:hypothetical protein
VAEVARERHWMELRDGRLTGKTSCLGKVLEKRMAMQDEVDILTAALKAMLEYITLMKGNLQMSSATERHFFQKRKESNTSLPVIFVRKLTPLTKIPLNIFAQHSHKIKLCLPIQMVVKLIKNVVLKIEFVLHSWGYISRLLKRQANLRKHE